QSSESITLGIIIRAAVGMPISPTKISPHILGLTGVRPVRDRKIENMEREEKQCILGSRVSL
ncbi:unnamed protein product, partial [marine sediment metagenome]